MNAQQQDINHIKQALKLDLPLTIILLSMWFVTDHKSGGVQATYWIDPGYRNHRGGEFVLLLRK